MSNPKTWAEAFPRAAAAATGAAHGVPAVQNSAAWIPADSQTYQDISWWAPAFTGQVVTKETAMRVSAVYACVRLICGSLASMPLVVYERTSRGPVPIEDHPLWWLLNEEPTARYTAATASEYSTQCVLLRGDAFRQIVRDRAGGVAELVPQDPDMTIAERRGNRLGYYVQDGETRFGLDQDDMLHLPGFGFNGLRSMSVIQWAAKQSIGIAMAAEEHSARFFSNGAQPSFVLQAPGKMSPEQQDRLRQQFAEKVAGTQNAFKPFVLTEGITAKEVSLSAQDAQLMEARKFQVIDIARAFGVPPFMIGEMEKTSSWGSGVAEMALGFMKYTLQPYITRFEQEMNRKLFRTPKYYLKYDVTGLLRGDDKALAEFFRQAIGGSQGPGWMTRNEVRRKVDLLPMDGGDELYDPNKGNNNAKPSQVAAAGN
ncbi:phage portal protein [Ralstonia syzygii subsp. celebesensis]|uniref:Phage related protein, HK97 portal domain n=1 Tax=blood disease bacterium R229 TaxID=741978 RepID=G2ZJ49_9RALS|nr:phage portal protein [Ralstonia syzygii]QQV54636.1 phage portal protein [Ralstonia syzygii subsp. celebesensis]CCA79062.1 phage related protein, HK97 portal domain [blood disease bacterium R229]